jgi:hypothetical protein
MSEIDSGGKAFPSHGTMGEVTHEGMTLRQWFAGMALQVITKNISLEDFVSLQPQELADGAFKIADAMIRAGKG